LYKDYFGLEEAPFSIAPDPRYLYMSRQHQEALAHLLYGLESNGGFVLLTGEVGTGKTTICRSFLELIPEQTDVAFIFNPSLTAGELLATICDEFGISRHPWEVGGKFLVDRLNSFLLERHSLGRKAILVIDEAQNLGRDVLEQLRLLTNLETNHCKLLQIILLGQPELKSLLGTRELRQLSQRIVARYHLKPLSTQEVFAYVTHRLSVAGLDSGLFSHAALVKIARESRGVPRVINILCDRGLLGAYATGQLRVGAKIITKASREVTGAPDNKSWAFRWSLVFIFLGVLVWGALALGPGGFMTPDGERVPLDQANSVPTPTAPPMSSGDWPHFTGTDKSHEFLDLFQPWGISPPDLSLDPCLVAQRYGLQCMTKKGSLRDLRHLNRPALLTLVRDDGELAFSTLVAFEQGIVHLKGGGGHSSVSVQDLERKWTGDFTLFWRPPPGYTEKLRHGDKGPLVAWLERELSHILGLTPDVGEDLLFDDTLEGKVQKFQLAAGLVPDGIVGENTLIHLNTITGTGIPLLSSRPEDF